MRADGSGQGLTGAGSPFPHSLELIPSPADSELQIYITSAPPDVLGISRRGGRGTEVSVVSVCAHPAWEAARLEANSAVQ